MRMVAQWRENKPIIAPAQIRRQGRGARPARNPLPELLLRVTLQAPVLGRGRRIIDKPTAKHLHAAQVAQELRVRAQLHVVIRRGRGCGRQAVRRILECCDQCALSRTRERLQN